MFGIFPWQSSTVVRPFRWTPLRYGVLQYVGMAIGVLLSAMVLDIDRGIATSLRRQYCSADYSIASGIVTRSELIRPNASEADSCRAELEYRYCVADREYRGRQSHESLWLDRCWRQMVIERPRGGTITVYYDPNCPSEAVIHRGVDGSDLYQVLAAFPYNIGMLAFCFVAGGKFYRWTAQPPAGGAKLWIEDGCVRVRLPRWDPLAVATAAAAAVNLIGICCFAQGLLDATVPAVVMVFGVVLVAAAGAYLVLDGLLASGASDLVIDDAAQTVTLPQTMGRRGQAVVPMQLIATVKLDQVETRDYEGHLSYHFVPVMILDNGTGTTRRERLAQWLDLGAAQDFAAWLRERVWVATRGACEKLPVGLPD